MTSPTQRRRKPLKPSVASLSALGAERLAELLLAAAKTETGLKRVLTLEVARDSADLAEEIDKQVQRLRTAKGRINAPRAVALARELTRLLDAITRKLGSDDPEAAVMRLLDVLSLAPTLLARRTGEGRPLVEAFVSIEGLVAGLIPHASGSARLGLIEPVFQAFVGDQHGLAAQIIGSVSAALNAGERDAMRTVIGGELQAVEQRTASAGAMTQEVNRLTTALGQVADASGDVDAFAAAQKRREARFRDHVGVASRLLAAGRAEEALAALDERSLEPTGKELRIKVLDALGERDLAQTERWALFHSALSIEALRNYLKRLPDFDDAEREEEALTLVEKHRNATAAVGFFVRWPDHRRAGALVRTRLAEFDGAAEVILEPVAEALAHKDPLAATLLFRRLIDASLRHGSAGGSSRAVRYFGQCASLATAITAWEGRPDHTAYTKHLRILHARKPGFWRRVST